MGALVASTFLFSWVGCADDDGDPGESAGGEGGSGGSMTETGGTGGRGGAGGTAGGGAGGHAAGSGGTEAGAAGAAGAGGEGTAPGEDLNACFEDVDQSHAGLEALELAGDDVSVLLVRYPDPDGAGTSGTTPWLPERFGVERAGAAVCVSDRAALDYQVTHHNFDDSLVATSDRGTFDFRQQRTDYGEPMEFSVSGEPAVGAPFEALALTLVRCRVLDTGNDCSTRYQ